MAVADVAEFNKAIVDAARKTLCAPIRPTCRFTKPLAFRDSTLWAKPTSHIRSVAPDVVIIGDGKRGDIASTNVMYAKAMFDVWGFDAITVNAYGGGESLEPFLEYEDRGTIVWCRSSNPGAKELQDIMLTSDEGVRLPNRNKVGLSDSFKGTRSESVPTDRPFGEIPLYEWMAKLASGWNSRGNVGLVVGSTYPEQLRVVRAHSPGMPILIPGIGAQGGDLESSVKLGLDEKVSNIIISSSRGITYASRDEKHYADAAREAAGNLQERVNRILLEMGRGW